MNKIIGGIAVAALVLSGFALFNKPVTKIVEQTFGGASSVFNQPDLTVNGVTEYKYSVGLTQATTTICAIQSPAATSTLRFAAVRFSVSSTTASTVTMAKSATAFATTTAIGGGALAASAQGTFSATTTPATLTSLDGVTTFAPSQWIVVGMAGGTGTFSPSGVCQAVFVAI